MMDARRLFALTVISGALSAIACARSVEGGGEEVQGSSPTEPAEDRVVLPPPSTSSGGASSTGSSGTAVTPKDAGSTSSSSSSSSSTSSSGSTGLASCTLDPLTFILKLNEIQAGAPCDSSCDPSTKCCLDMTGGGSSGLPADSGAPTGAGICVTK